MPTSKASKQKGQPDAPDAADRSGHQAAPEPVTEAEREHGAGKFGRLAGPRPPDREQDLDTPVMGVVPPDPNMADEAGEMDLMRGDPNRVREAARGSATDESERDAAEKLRRDLYREGATEVSED